LESSKKPKVSRLTTALIAVAIICLLVGGTIGYAINSLTSSSQISDLESRISTLEEQVSGFQPTTNVSSQISDLESRISSLEKQFSELQSTTNVSSQISDLESRISTLEEQVSDLQSVISRFSQNVTYENITYVFGENFSLSQLYDQVKNSIVMIQGVIVQYDYFGDHTTQGCKDQGSSLT
jgi:uncharacterized coiled-coil protein SlyX